MTLERFSLAGKKALVTGASRGIGQVIAVAFAEAGADVTITARGAEGLAATAKGIRDFGREAVEIPAELTTQQAAAGVVATAIDRLGHLDIVVNNAGGSNFVVPFLDMRLSGWEKVLRLNLDATMWVASDRLVVHDRPGPCHRRRPDQHRLTPGLLHNFPSFPAPSAPDLRRFWDQN
ncbi:MAG TPA: SDR family NAD(P)-dependent oxidoreductase [Trebonia sp.]|nr:SDR family NAD(P)-dependent oxidoreductase [Trebonia sp.]